MTRESIQPQDAQDEVATELQDAAPELAADELPIAVERLPPRAAFTAQPQALPPFPSLLHANESIVLLKPGQELKSIRTVIGGRETVYEPKRRGRLAPALAMLSLALWSGLAAYVMVKQDPLRLTVIPKLHAERILPEAAQPESQPQ